LGSVDSILGPGGAGYRCENAERARAVTASAPITVRLVRAKPEGLEVGSVVDALRRGWGFDARDAEYVIRTAAGRLHVDWDTVALAPPERDLWMLVAAGTDAAALDFFRLTWDLKDLAEYVNVLRAPHHENDDTVSQYRALTRCVAIRERWAAHLD
jgi:hypothetical protein